MFIKRLSVEEGFFNDLEIEFHEGLNVLIGGRGVGKTSVIELIRFCLGVPGGTNDASRDAKRHALSVLQTGQVTVEIAMGDRIITVTRTADQELPKASDVFYSPVIFSQKEIESVGMDSAGRLALIDGFLESVSTDPAELSSLAARIRSGTARLSELRSEVEGISQRVMGKAELAEKQKALRAEQDQLSAKDRKIRDAQRQLDKLNGRVNQLAIDIENLSQQGGFITEVQQQLMDLGGLAFPEDWPKNVKSDMSRAITTEVNRDLSEIRGIAERFSSYREGVGQIRQALIEEREPLEAKTRQLRQEVNAHNEGAGTISRELARAEEALARIKNYESYIKVKTLEIDAIIDSVIGDLEKMSAMRHMVFTRRKEVVDMLNAGLGPRINIKLDHLANLEYYQASITETLKGSGLRYSEISPLIAKLLSPTELFVLAQNKNHQEFAEIVEITTDRAARLIGQFSETDLGSILTAKLADEAKFFFMDGSKNKPINELSIGQRCTVALSIVLENVSRPLLVDQPEDHLDNEFIADTLIRALQARSEKAQTIISSHNANIPVLANANRVIELGSNGRRGFIKEVGDLKDQAIVTSITDIMEGGEKAFRIRSAFYNLGPST